MRGRHQFFCVALLLSLLSLSSLCAAQRPLNSFGSSSDVNLRIMLDNEHPVGTPVNVQLLSAGGSPVQEVMSNDRGEALFKHVPSGSYRVKISGNGIKDTEMDLNSSDGGVTQFVRVAPALGVNASASSDPGVAGTSKSAYVSAAQLAVPDKARKEFDKGARSLNDSDLGSAKKHFEKALEISPRYASALNNLGIVAVRENDNDKAYDYFQRAVQADDTSVQALVNLGKMEMMKKNLQGAVPSLERAGTLAPTDAQVFNLLAVAEVQIGDDDKALANARKVHTLEHAKYAICHYISANILHRRHQAADAIAEYELFLKEAPDSPTASKARAELKLLKTEAVTGQQAAGSNLR